jgi:hypothetical protein
LDRAGQLLLRAMELDEKLRLGRLDKSLYRIVSAWSRSGRRDAPARAAALLEAFQSRSKKPVQSACLQIMKDMQSSSFKHEQKTTDRKKLGLSRKPTKSIPSK